MRLADRSFLPFRAVNCEGAADYTPGLQRHHLLPRQLLQRRCFGRMLAHMDRPDFRFHDFRRNGLLLPCVETLAVRLGLPLHRGPHRRYSALVAERVGQVEARWSVMHVRDAREAADEAHFRLALLQRALARMLLQSARQIQLNRYDPQWQASDFAELDAMAEGLWGATARIADQAARRAT